MNIVTRSWVRKAERDFKVAQGLMRRWVAGYGDAACFHCQQAVEHGMPQAKKPRPDQRARRGLRGYGLHNRRALGSAKRHRLRRRNAVTPTSATPTSAVEGSGTVGLMML